jgi:hypothetical protein
MLSIVINYYVLLHCLIVAFLLLYNYSTNVVVLSKQNKFIIPQQWHAKLPHHWNNCVPTRHIAMCTVIIKADKRFDRSLSDCVRVNFIGSRWRYAQRDAGCQWMKTVGAGPETIES